MKNRSLHRVQLAGLAKYAHDPPGGAGAAQRIGWPLPRFPFSVF